MTTLAAAPAGTIATAVTRGEELRRGWGVLASAMFGIVALMAPVHVAGVYMPHWEQEFGWSRAEMATALSLYIAATSLLAPGIGAVVDRWGARRVALISMTLLIPGYAFFALLQPSIWTLYAAFIVVAVLGAGTTQVVFCRPIVQAFDAARGLALALAQSGTAISLVFAPIIGYALLQVTDWRTSWLALACIPLLLLLLVYAGLRPVRTAQSGARAERPMEVGVAFGEAIRSGKFWLFVISFSLFYFGTAATVGQLVPIVEATGLSTEQAIAAQGLLGIAVMVGRLGTGYLLDRIFASYIYMAMGILAAAGFFVLALGVSDLVWLAIPCIGLAVGAEVDIASYMVSRYFGQRHFGKLFGLTFAMLCAGGIVAHPFYGIVFDITGTYAAATATSMIVVFIAGAMLLRQEPYPDLTRRAETAPAGG